jgi:hypothetical protein
MTNTGPHGRYPHTYSSSNTSWSQFAATQGNPKPVIIISTDPINGSSMLTGTDIWYVFKAGSRNCVASVSIESAEMYQLINTPRKYTRGRVINGAIPRTDLKLLLWSPKYNCLIHMEDIEISYHLSGDGTGTIASVEFGTYWAPNYGGSTVNVTPDQCVWYRDYTDHEIGDPNHFIPPIARNFRLPTLPKREPMPDFEDGDAAYAWINAQLD